MKKTSKIGIIVAALAISAVIVVTSTVMLLPKQPLIIKNLEPIQYIFQRVNAFFR